MIVYLSMYELMDNHIIDSFHWRLDQPPGEIQGAFCTAGAPACARGSDPNSGVLKAILMGMEFNSLVYDLAGLFPVPSLKCNCSIFLCRGGELKLSILQQQAFLLPRDDFEGIRFPQILEFLVR